MSDDRVSWFDSRAVKRNISMGPFYVLFFLTVSFKTKEEYSSLYLLTSPVLVIITYLKLVILLTL